MVLCLVCITGWSLDWAAVFETDLVLCRCCCCLSMMVASDFGDWPDIGECDDVVTLLLLLLLDGGLAE